MVSYIRRARPSDVDKIVSILEQGQEYLRAQGSPQWQNGSGPGRADVEGDLARREGYTFLYEGEIRGYGAMLAGEDPIYTGITQGAWDPDSDGDGYIVIHRVAVDAAVRGKGLAKLLMRDLIVAAGAQGYRDIRVDTHPMNDIMQRVILHTGFGYRGMIQFPFANGERKAYQLLLD